MAGPAEQTAPREDLREGWKRGQWRQSLWDLYLQSGQTLPKALSSLPLPHWQAPGLAPARR